MRVRRVARPAPHNRQSWDWSCQHCSCSCSHSWTPWRITFNRENKQLMTENNNEQREWIAWRRQRILFAQHYWPQSKQWRSNSKAWATNINNIRGQTSTSIFRNYPNLHFGNCQSRNCKIALMISLDQAKSLLLLLESVCISLNSLAIVHSEYNSTITTSH